MSAHQCHTSSTEYYNRGNTVKTLIEENLERITQDRGINYSELSKMSCVSKGYIRSIRHGDDTAPSVWTLKRLADALGCKIDDLIATKSQGSVVDNKTAWISVEDRVPVDLKPVLCLMKYSYNGRMSKFIGSYARKFELESSEDYDGWCDYCEKSGEYFCPEGWYEQQINWGDYMSIAVSEGGVTHWMPLPESPKVKV